MFFSAASQEQTPGTNPLYVLRGQILAAGGALTDLISGNVNEQGMVFPQDLLKETLAEAADAAAVYRPDPLGQRVARGAIAAYYAALRISPDRILLTPGSSVSYWYCFKLLARSGDEILCPQPSYPLFQHIAGLAGVRLTGYRLVESRGWAMDLEHLERQVSTRTRAIVVISPHNPTGAVAGEEELAGLAEIAARHRLAIIADEVFSEFLFGLPSLPRPAATAAPLVFTLNGFSKMFALPGMKIGWMCVTGEEPLVRKALAALELMSDTFLPANEIAQFAVPGIFRRGTAFLGEYRRWVAACRDAAVRALEGIPLVPPRGGFYITFRIPGDEEQTALRLLRDQRILVHPGYFYDMEPAHLVATFAHDPARLADALGRVKQRL